MVRKPISQEFWTWQHVNFDTGVLTAGGTAILKNIVVDVSRGQGFRMSALRYWVEYGGKTAEQGPILWGLAWGLTAAEVGETMNSDPQFDVEVDMELVRRNLIVIGLIPNDATKSGELAGTTRYLSAQTLRKIKVPSWDVVEGTAILLWQCVLAGGDDVATGCSLELTLGIKGGWLDA